MFLELHQRPEPTNIPFIPICKAVTTHFLSGETLHNWVFIDPTWETSGTCLWTCIFFMRYVWWMFFYVICLIFPSVIWWPKMKVKKKNDNQSTHRVDFLCPGKLTHDYLHLKNLLELFYYNIEVAFLNTHIMICIWSLFNASDFAFLFMFAVTEFPSLFLSHGTVITMNLQRHWCIFFWHLTVHMDLSWHLRALSGWHWII